MWSFKRSRKKTEIEELKRQIDTLHQLVESNKQPIEYHFHINQVDIHHPTLEELNFKLDQIDIEDLSGALNVGNNFGVSVRDRKNKKKCGSDDSEIKAKATKNGYSFSFNSKEE
ncbi:hypothetical protein [Bacillus sp. Marseille-Q3570]|uniref:hypothetical protein n=1 Tax=Bacillus sp. Marseille-Q3570 TaxID=2963522 RepID=UPI0021B77248|nr:hypothetical protein [Bacillus sp. Marseille-Q3570]